ncbi:hypothetical protein TIFTF001_004716 [Ficus carica]|uniref:Cytochrome P450 n=1 Tax=Ficus carica TaxID=3494 RepID=A0AA88CWF7_FICCA|nr:hypothetical protein TIFTF001_004716 [Ficus carica]
MNQIFQNYNTFKTSSPRLSGYTQQLRYSYLTTRLMTAASADMTRGTILFVNAWAIHRDPRHWDDAESFKPERFETISEGGDEVNKLMPFAVGRRACPGEGLAQRVVGLALGLLIQCFEWERLSEEEVDMVEGRGVIMPKALALEAKCKPRQIIKKSTSLLESPDDI